MNASLKAGLVGAGVALVVILVGLIPCLGCIAPILGLLLYIGVGALAVKWMDPPVTAGSGAGAGALAAVITSLVYGVLSAVVNGIRFTITGGAPAMMRNIPPELLRQLRDVGIDPGAIASMGGVLISATMCCILGLALAAVLGALGGAIMATTRSD